MSITSTLGSQLQMFTLVIDECRREGVTDPELIDLVWDELKDEDAPNTPGKLLDKIHVAIKSALFI